MLFLYLLRRLCSLYASFYWWDESRWLICLCWTSIPRPGDKSQFIIVYYPLNVLWKFDLLIFHWRYLILCLLEILVYCFILLWCLYFTLESKMILASSNEFRHLAISAFQKNCINSLCMFDRMYQWSHLALVFFFLWGSLWLLLQLLILLGLFMLLYFLKLF